MVKSVLSVSHRGLRDWVFQRITAGVMAVYVIGLMVYLLLNPHLYFAEWHTLFCMLWMKIATAIFLGSLLVHAWIGMWTIVTDYVKPFMVRCVLHVGVLLALFVYFVWGLMMLGSV